MKSSIYFSICTIMCSILSLNVFGQGIESVINKAQIDFIYSDTKLPFPENDRKLWSVGSNFTGDFEVSYENIFTDIAIFRPDLVIQRSNGHVGIGLFGAAQARLHVGHIDSDASLPNIPAVMIGDYSGDVSYGYLTVNQPSSDLSENIARFRYDGSTIMQVSKSSSTYQLQIFGDALAMGGMWIDSDRRLKENIQAIPSALSGLKKLKPSTYYYKPSSYLPTEKQFGVIAQDLQKVYPHLVRESVRKLESDAEPQAVLSVNYNGLIPVLIASVQELDQNQSQTSDEISKLKEENKLLKERIERLERLIQSGSSK